MSGLVVDGVARFASKGRPARATELVIHETVTHSVAWTIAVLQKRGLRVHLVMGPDGELTQHGDLAKDVLRHAGPALNRPSFGVEVVNPCYPRDLKPGLPWSRVIDVPWAHERRYVPPTAAQAEAVCLLIRWTTNSPAPGVEVPRTWVGLKKGAMQLGPVAAAAEEKRRLVE